MANQMSESIMAIIPLLIPLVIIQVGLLIAAIVHIAKHDKYKIGNRPMWIVICVLVNIIGPVLYFILGRSDE